MRRELIICIVVIALIIVLNIITSQNTARVMDKITDNLSLTREAILKQEEKEMKEHIEKVTNIWEEEKDKLGMYIEHDEIEKVELYMTNVSTDIETKEYNMALEALDSCTFIIEHIREKYALLLENIF